MKPSVALLLLQACHAESPPDATQGPTATAAPPRIPIALAPGHTLDLPDGTTLTLESLDFEPHLDATGQPAGRAAVLELDAEGDSLSLRQVPAGGVSATGWIGGVRVTLVDATPEAAHLHLDQRSETAAGAVRRRVALNERVVLDDDLFLRFLGHGHKSVMAGGPSSPLVVHVAYERIHPADAEPQEEDRASYSLYPPESASWKWRELELRLTDHRYGEWMELDIAHFELHPVTPSP